MSRLLSGITQGGQANLDRVAGALQAEEQRQFAANQGAQERAVALRGQSLQAQGQQAALQQQGQALQQQGQVAQGQMELQQQQLEQDAIARREELAQKDRYLKSLELQQQRQMTHERELFEKREEAERKERDAARRRQLERSIGDKKAMAKTTEELNKLQAERVQAENNLGKYNLIQKLVSKDLGRAAPRLIEQATGFFAAEADVARNVREAAGEALRQSLEGSLEEFDGKPGFLQRALLAFTDVALKATGGGGITGVAESIEKANLWERVGASAMAAKMVDTMDIRLLAGPDEEGVVGEAVRGALKELVSSLAYANGSSVDAEQLGRAATALQSLKGKVSDSRIMALLDGIANQANALESKEAGLEKMVIGEKRLTKEQKDAVERSMRSLSTVTDAVVELNDFIVAQGLGEGLNTVTFTAEKAEEMVADAVLEVMGAASSLEQIDKILGGSAGDFLDEFPEGKLRDKFEFAIETIMRKQQARLPGAGLGSFEELQQQITDLETQREALAEREGEITTGGLLESAGRAEAELARLLEGE